MLTIAVTALLVLHQDFWFWRSAEPFIFGFIPIGLFYHACYTVAASIVMWALVKCAWPEHLEEDINPSGASQGELLRRAGEENQAH